MILSNWSSDKSYLAGKIFFETLNKAAGRVLKKKQDYLVSVKFVGDSQMINLNKKWAGKNGPTDVLSWPFMESGRVVMEKGLVLAGEIVIDYKEAKRQAVLRGHSLRRELARLYIHGLLHLFGFDHDSNSKLKNMKKAEDKILQLAGKL